MHEVEIVNGSQGLEIFLLQKWEYSLHLQFWDRMKKNKTKNELQFQLCHVTLGELFNVWDFLSSAIKWEKN